MAWIMATKLEMTRVIKGDRFVPVTLLQVPKLRVVWYKTLEKDGYKAIIVWILIEKAEWVLKDWKTTMSKNEFSTISKFPVTQEEIERYKVGDEIGLDSVEVWGKIIIEWITKWKWFAWAMKRHNFHGWPASHGSKFHRALGSIGNRKPTRTHKGKKMHGHMGNEKISIKKVPIELINNEISIIGVRGGVPGWRNSIINIIF